MTLKYTTFILKQQNPFTFAYLHSFLKKFSHGSETELKTLVFVWVVTTLISVEARTTKNSKDNLCFTFSREHFSVFLSPQKIPYWLRAASITHQLIYDRYLMNKKSHSRKGTRFMEKEVRFKSSKAADKAPFSYFSSPFYFLDWPGWRRHKYMINLRSKKT